MINEGFDLVRDDATETAIHVDYIDFEQPENNVFKVVNQFTIVGESERRPDMLVLLMVFQLQYLSLRQQSRKTSRSMMHGNKFILVIIVTFLT